MFIGGLSVESVIMFAVSALMFIFPVACLVVLYCAYCFSNEVHQHPISYRGNNTESQPTEEIKTQNRHLTSSPLRKLEVIIEHQEEENSSIAKL